MAEPMKEVEVGFTGTRDSMTIVQYGEFARLLDSVANDGDRFHQGCCVGADEEASIAARGQGLWIVGHPPIDKKLVSTFQSDEECEPEEYLVRNKNIVDASTVMIATPGGMVEVLRSGTWSTIRYARKQGRELYIIFPDGRITHNA